MASGLYGYYDISKTIDSDKDMIFDKENVKSLFEFLYRVQIHLLFKDDNIIIACKNDNIEREFIKNRNNRNTETNETTKERV